MARKGKIAYAKAVYSKAKVDITHLSLIVIRSIVYYLSFMKYYFNLSIYLFIFLISPLQMFASFFNAQSNAHLIG